MSGTRHVVVLTAGGDLGGAERSLLSLIAHAPRDLRFTLVLPAGGDLPAAAATSGVDVRVAPWPARLLALGERAGGPGVRTLGAAVPAIRGAAATVRACLRTLAPDVVVTNGIKPHVVGALAVRGGADLPLMWYLRESTEGRWLSRLALRAAAARCDAAIAISRYVAADASRYLPATVPVSVIYNIVDPVPGTGEDRDTPVRPAGEFWFAAVGGLTPLKGHDVFLRAAAAVRRVRPDARFLVIGANRYAPEQGAGHEGRLRQLAADLGLGDAVRFLGHRRDVTALLRQVDVLVQSNTAPEGFGRSVVEAMAAGVPVIASRAWSFLELIDDGRTGWLVPAGDAEALAERMLAVAADAAGRQRIAAQARAFVAGAIQPAACVEAFAAAVRAAVARRTHRSAVPA